MHSKKAGAIGAVLATALLLSGCSSSGSEPEASGDSELTPVKLQLQWLTQSQFAGYYAALDQGYYEDEGLDVEIIPSGGDIVPQDALAAGDVDYAIAWVPKVLGSIEQGANITNVAQIFERSATLQVAFADSGITTPEDLEGKTIGSWGYGNEWELYAGLNKAGITDPDIVTQAFDMEGLLSGEIDAAQAMTYNEYAQLLETTNPDTGELYTPEDFSVINWNDEGTSMLQDAIWADAERLADADSDYAETTVKFLKASVKGWVYARDNVEEIPGIVTEAGSTLGASHQLWMANETNKLIWPSGDRIGVIQQDAWDQTVDLALKTSNENGPLITADPPETAFSNEYIEQALSELEGEDVDVTGADYSPIEVTLEPGGE
ncbi:ABC transporter substrate-binding protein [Mycetocola reblochoni]|uniref:Thiamine pyrimidine synthase n=2 Tax=Mycetocola reblochoni TaxID=331618 RepID=A0A1R4ITV7_9MICO|nr:ABC transporter substrate-binding protein [Mycetocola reblochoni]RLP71043.1 ABC transporter substrate-binding protein [Mycetocola reblochoni]SJN23290.1 Pyrimidine ABC transporter, substrate-binding component [Mycetocola reblochoni REB411]